MISRRLRLNRLLATLPNSEANLHSLPFLGAYGSARGFGNRFGGEQAGGGSRASLVTLGATGAVGLVAAYSLGFFEARLPIHKVEEKEAHLRSLDEEESDYSAPAVPTDKSRRARLNFFAEVVAKAAPSVVFIQQDRRIMTPFLGPAISQMTGSGTIVRADGLILTNAHIVGAPKDRLKVRLHDGREFEGRVVAMDPSSDLATIKIQAINLPALQLADSNKASPGEFVVALGSPLALTNTVTTGVISSTSRKLTELMPEGMPMSHMKIPGSEVDLSKMTYLQTDAAINVGNSGGPLVNLDGELVGVNSMTIAPATGISFAIPSNHVRRFLITADRATAANASSKAAALTQKRRSIGITMMSLTPQVIRELNIGTNSGVLVYSIYEGSPAKKAGLEPGDVIVEINGRRIASDHQVREAVETSVKLQLRVVRRGREMNMTILTDEL